MDWSNPKFGFNRWKSATTARIDYSGLNSTGMSTPWPIMLWEHLEARFNFQRCEPR